MPEVEDLSKGDFAGVWTELESFGAKGHELLVVGEGVLRTQEKSYSLLANYFKPQNERIREVAEFALEFFSHHAEYLQDKVDSLSKFQPVFVKAGCPEKFNLLVDRIRVYTLAQSVLSPDIIRLILGYLSSSEIARSTEVCKSFRDAVASSDFLQAKIKRGQGLRKLTVNFRSSVPALHVIAAKQMKEGDYSEAYATIRKANAVWVSDDKEHCFGNQLRNLAAKQAETDLKGAFAALGNISCENCRRSVRSKMIGIQSKTDPDGAFAKVNQSSRKEQLISEILMAQLQPTLDVDQKLSIDWTLEAVEGLSNPFLKDQVITKMLEVMIKRDLEEAFAYISRLPDSDIRDDALLLIGLEKLKMTLKAAVEELDSELRTELKAVAAIAKLIRSVRKKCELYLAIELEMTKEGRVWDVSIPAEIEHLAAGEKRYFLAVWCALQAFHQSKKDNMLVARILFSQSYRIILSLIHRKDARRALKKVVDLHVGADEANVIPVIRRNYHPIFRDLALAQAAQALAKRNALAGLGVAPVISGVNLRNKTQVKIICDYHLM